MKWAPLLMFATNFWMFSNREIFENYAELDAQARPEVETTGHVLFKGVTNTPAFSLFVIFWILLVGLLFQRLISKVMQKTPFLIKIEEHIDENLPSYVKALEYDDSMYLMGLERHLRKHYGIKTLMDSTLLNIVNTKPAYKKISGIGIYDILANVRYCNKFQYDYYEQVYKVR
jgi:hypothetical protein